VNRPAALGRRRSGDTPALWKLKSEVLRSRSRLAHGHVYGWPVAAPMQELRLVHQRERGSGGASLPPIDGLVRNPSVDTDAAEHIAAGILSLA
jgi:hypothetical protein